MNEPKKSKLLFVLVLLIACLLLILIPQNTHFKSLDLTLPNVPLKGAYYINLDKSVHRRTRFLAGYNGTLPIERVPGVKVEKKIGILGPGTRGCALAHCNAMSIIGKKEDGWYLVCEDDCIGDFSKLEENIILRNIVHKTSKQFINLGKYKWSSYSLSEVNMCLQAYMLTPACARKTVEEIMKTIDGPRAKPVDELIVKLYRTPRFFGQSGDGSGCHVRLFDAVGPSDIMENGR